MSLYNHSFGKTNILNRKFLEKKYNDLTKESTIDLSNNRIKTIDPKTFNGLSNLQIIRLDNNQLTTIDPKTFNGLDKLKRIELHENKFKVDKLKLILEKSVVYVSFKSNSNNIESIESINKDMKQTDKIIKIAEPHSTLEKKFLIAAVMPINFPEVS